MGKEFDVSEALSGEQEALEKLKRASAKRRYNAEVIRIHEIAAALMQDIERVPVRQLIEEAARMAFDAAALMYGDRR